MKITKNKLKKIIRSMLAENSKVKTVEQDFVDRVNSGEAPMDEGTKITLTQRELRQTIRKVIKEMRGPEDLPYGNVTGEEPSHNTGPDGRQTEGSLRQFVDQHIDDFIDLYIRTSSSPENFWDFWEMHCEEELGIYCTQDQLVALVDRAEEMEEIEPGELFVGTRGAY